MHFLRSKLKMVLLLHLQHNFILVLRSTVGGGVYGGSGVYSCDDASEPETDTSPLLSNWGMSAITGGLLGGLRFAGGAGAGEDRQGRVRTGRDG